MNPTDPNQGGLGGGAVADTNTGQTVPASPVTETPAPETPAAPEVPQPEPEQGGPDIGGDQGGPASPLGGENPVGGAPVV